MCNTNNPENMTHCYKCGHQIINTYDDAKIEKSSPVKKLLGLLLLTFSGVIILFIAIAILLIAMFSDSSSPKTNNVVNNLEYVVSSDVNYS